MFPYRDDNPTLATPAVTYLLIGLNVAAWVLVQGMGAEPYLSRVEIWTLFWNTGVDIPLDRAISGLFAANGPLLTDEFSSCVSKVRLPIECRSRLRRSTADSSSLPVSGGGSSHAGGSHCCGRTCSTVRR